MELIKATISSFEKIPWYFPRRNISTIKSMRMSIMTFKFCARTFWVSYSASRRTNRASTELSTFPPPARTRNDSQCSKMSSRMLSMPSQAPAEISLSFKTSSHGLSSIGATISSVADNAHAGLKFAAHSATICFAARSAASTFSSAPSRMNGTARSPRILLSVARPRVCKTRERRSASANEKVLSALCSSSSQARMNEAKTAGGTARMDREDLRVLESSMQSLR
mmetsp:Transcript_9111/g.23910  ORF Transcript_9111/g.23910 Transcript_9111/m.23910 type:complete len:224 (-) Transcript_9111:65-736(-)